ncbi:MAG: glycosyltransferase family 4 protein [bacterium]|nr:glycosyltransferase family 4 protein [bacterium]
MNRKPRIQIFLKNLSDDKAAEVARRMPFLKRDFRVGVTHNSSAVTDEGAFADSGIPLTAVEVAPLPPDDLLNYMRAFIASLQEDLPDAVMAALPDGESAAFLIAAKSIGVPLVIAELDDQPSLISSFEEISALHFCDVILPAARNLQRVLMQMSPELTGKISTLLPHSADTTYIQQTKEDRRRHRLNLNVDTDLKMITMIAAFDRRRDYDTLLDACALLKQQGHEFIVLLVGDGPERRRITEKVYALRLGEQVTIIDDPGDHADILCATDIFALSTHLEGNSTPLIEAMAHGLAIAATDVPGISDLIRDGRSGKLAAPKNPESMAQALVDLLAQEKIRKKLGSVARKCIDNRGNLNQFMPAFISTLKKKLKEINPESKPAGYKQSLSETSRQYVYLQERIRELIDDTEVNFGISQAADLLDGYPINVQVDILEKLCRVPVEAGPLAMFVRPLEKVLSDRYLDALPFLEMRLFEKLAAFYIELGYVEGAEKLMERMEANIQKELFRYLFANQRFSGIRAIVRLAQLYDFVGQKDRRDFYRLELREFLQSNPVELNVHFHQQNAVFLESLGELKLAMREMQKDSLGPIHLEPDISLMLDLPGKDIFDRKTVLKGVTIRPVPASLRGTSVDQYDPNDILQPA